MNPAKVRRERLERLTDLPNVGPAMARDFVLMGFSHPGELAGADPLVLYRRLCGLTGQRQDPCVLDTFISVCRFLEGEEARPWWAYTGERKRLFPDL